MNLATPHMSPARVDALSTALQKSKVYLEFGMGGSTVLAARLGVPQVYAVDSSQDWVQLVSKDLSGMQTTSQVRLLHANLGPTKEWGYPVDNAMIANWPSYYSGPWRVVREAGLQPDLVLVDGRFRVACFLYSMLQMQPGSTLLWDDYTNRSEYHVVERFLKPVAYHDEMAVFEVTGREDRSAIADALFSGLYVLD
jgi:hypothetical protein